MNNTKLKKGGIDTIIAYIVVILPLVYILAFIIAIIYHFSVQGYIAQVAKELAISASTYGEITEPMQKRVYDRLEALDLGRFQIAIKVREYVEESNTFGTPSFYTTAPGNWNPIDSEASIPTLDSDDLKQKSIVAVYLRSEEPSLLATVANFGLFGGDGTSTLNYSAFREEIVRYAPEP